MQNFYHKQETEGMKFGGKKKASGSEVVGQFGSAMEACGLGFGQSVENSN
jgi:hypothetical protein